MSNLFGDTSIPLKCPKCGHETKQKITQLERNPNIICPRCGVTIAIKADELRKATQQINKMVDDLKRKFR